MTHHGTEELALFAVNAPLPKSGAAPEWITIFPKIGRTQTRDGRTYTVDAEAMIRAFEADGIDIPVDLNHTTDTAISHGKEAPAIGWITALKVERDALRGKVDWLAKGKETLAAREYRYISPSFWHSPAESGNTTTRLKAVALVTAPALGQQQAIASARGGRAARGAVLAAESGELIYGVVASLVPQGRTLPDWVAVFPALGFVETRQEEVFYIDGTAIVDNFAAATRGRDEDYREFPVGLEHRAEQAFDAGEDFDDPPLGYVTDLRIAGGRLEAKITWEKEAETVFVVYAAVSPAFFVEPGGKVKRLKSLSLVRRAIAFAKSRALGNDATRQERGYQAPTPTGDTGQIAAKGMRALTESQADALAQFVLQHRPDLLPGATQSAASARETPQRPLDPVQRLDEERRQADAENIKARRQARTIAQETKQLFANAAAEGEALSFLDAVAIADARLAASGGVTAASDRSDEATLNALIVEGLKHGAAFSRNDARRLAQLMTEGGLGAKHLDEFEQATILGVKAYDIRAAALKAGRLMTEGEAAAEASSRLGLRRSNAAWMLTARVYRPAAQPRAFSDNDAPQTIAGKANALLAAAQADGRRMDFYEAVQVTMHGEDDTPCAIADRVNARLAAAEKAGLTMGFFEALNTEMHGVEDERAVLAGTATFHQEVSLLLSKSRELMARTAASTMPIDFLVALSIVKERYGIESPAATSAVGGVIQESRELAAKANLLVADAEAIGQSLDWCSAVALAEAGDAPIEAIRNGSADPAMAAQFILKEARAMVAASGGSVSFHDGVRQVADALGLD